MVRDDHASCDAPAESSFFLIGENSLLVPCMQRLLAGGHRIVGLTSRHPGACRWAREHELRIFDSIDDAAAALPEAFDYLLSVVNSRILSAKHLALPRKMAINYHDSPLPRYAGINATSWAILAGEATHGITWHEMVADFDAGDILVQQKVDIKEDDTAFALNARCFDAAVVAFDEMITRLENRLLQAQTQDLSQRTSYPSTKRIANAGLLDPEQPVSETERLLKALKFEPAPNLLTTPKLMTPAGPVTASEFSWLDQEGQCGEILALDSRSMTIGFADGKALFARDLKSLDGKSFDPSAAKYGLNVGELLPQPEPSQREEIARIDRLTGRSEMYWLNELQDFSPMSVVPSGDAAKEPDEVWCSPVRSVDDGWKALAAGLFLCSRLARSNKLHFFLREPGAGDELIDALFLPVKPIRLMLNDATSLANLAIELEERCAAAQKRGPLSADLRVRRLEFEAVILDQAAANNVSIVIGKIPESAEPGIESVCTFWLDPASNRIALHARSGRLRQPRPSELFSRIIELLESTPTGRALSSIDFLTASDRDSYSQLNRAIAPGAGSDRTDTGASSARTLHAMVLQSAAAHADAIAVIHRNAESNYSELSATATQIARKVAAQISEAKPATQNGSEFTEPVIVGVLMQRCTQLPAALLGTLTAGAAFLPLDPTYPESRLQFMVEDARCVAVVTDASTLALHPWIKALSIPLVMAEEEADEKPEATAVQFPDVAPSQAAYVIYTSGSTGTPKGVVISHAAICSYLQEIRAVYGLEPGQRMFQGSALGFDPSVEEIFLPLCFGGATALRDEADVLGARALTEACTRYGIHVCSVPTALWRVWAAQVEADMEWPAQMHTVVIGGEAAPLDAIRPWQQWAPPQSRLLNGYGPTETTITATIWDLRPFAADGKERVPIGVPVPGSSVFIVDEQQRVLPPGFVGELVIGGRHLADGYLRRPEQTQASFRPAPSEIGPGRNYHTGDLARLNPSGQLEFLGRVDHQIKLNGYRIELGEIEARCGDVPGVLQAAVRVFDSSLLVAYIVASGRSRGLIELLREQLSAQLPAQMMPHQFELLPELPITAGGKIDYRKLMRPQRNRSGKNQDDEPKTPTQKFLVDLWNEVLDTDDCGTSDRLLDRGGNSLMAVQLVARIEKQTGQRLGMQMVLVETLATVAGRLDGDAGSASEASPAPIVSRRTPAPRLEYWGPEGSQHFSVTQLPAGKPRGAVLICMPLMHEHMRAHRECRLLANALADAGFAVFRFDYLGTADSDRDLKSVGVSDWLEGIRQMIQRAVRISGHAKVNVVGLRLGAILAARALLDNPNVAHQIYWDALISGQPFLDLLDLIEAHSCRCDNHLAPIWRTRRPRPGFYMGYEISLELLEEIRALSWPLGLSAEATHQFTSADQASIGEPLPGQSHVTEDLGRWQDEQYWEVALKAPKTIQDILALLCGAEPT